MQLARIARGNRERTLYEKMVETGYALLLETVCGKHQILNLYASHAPFGGNVIASRRRPGVISGEAPPSYRGPRAPRSRFFPTPPP